MGILQFTVLFVIFVCRVNDFSAAEKDRGVKFCKRVGLLSGQVFLYFGELWLAGSHEVVLLSGMYAVTDAILRDRMDGACGGSVGQSE